MMYYNTLVQANYELRFPNRNILDLTLDIGFRIVVKHIRCR
jgi:hypothetical protein